MTTSAATNWLDAVAVETFNGQDRNDQRKASAKRATKALQAVGFTKIAAEKRHTASQPLGRSLAYSGTYDSRRTNFLHADGRECTMIERWSKYGDATVAVHAKRIG